MEIEPEISWLPEQPTDENAIPSSEAETRSRCCQSEATTRWFHTINVFLTLLAMGGVTAVTGTTSLDLSHIYKTDVSRVITLLSTRSAGILLGSLLCGNVIYRWVNARLVMGVLLMLGGTGTAVLASLPRLWLAHLGILATGISIGATEVGANVWLVQMWKDGVSPFLQTYHLSFGLGALLAPIIARPFLSDTGAINVTASGHTDSLLLALSSASPETAPTWAANIATLTGPGSESNNSGNTTTTSQSEIWIPYTMLGGSYASMGLLVLLGLLVDRQAFGWSNRASGAESAQEEVEVLDLSVSPAARRFDWAVICLLALYVVIDITIESCMSQMLSLYVVHNPALAMTPSTASYLVALFWAMYTGGRLVAIFASVRVRPHTILVAAQSLAAVGCALLFALVVDPTRAGHVTIWAGTAALGLGLAPLYGTSCTWAVQYVQLKHAHMSLVLVASCVGAMAPVYIVAPWLVDSAVEFPCVVLALGASQAGVLVAMLLATRGRPTIFDDDMRAAFIADIAGETK